jgi:site-specific DNA-methyltransferase (adenine-specific)
MSVINYFNNSCLINGDSLNEIPKIKSNSINMIFADPPYFLSNGGISCSSGKMVSVDKGEWDKAKDRNYIKEFTRGWIIEGHRVLHEDGTIWISGTYHNIFYVGEVLNELGFKILNIVTWVKDDPPPNLSRRMFTHSAEFIIWAKKSPTSRHFFNYPLMENINNGRQMTDVWLLPHVPKREKAFGYHPTQKPLQLMNRIILSSTKENDIVLDPFSGSGTTAVAAYKNGRRFIGIEKDINYYNNSLKRLTSATQSSNI